MKKKKKVVARKEEPDRKILAGWRRTFCCLMDGSCSLRPWRVCCQRPLYCKGSNRDPGDLIQHARAKTPALRHPFCPTLLPPSCSGLHEASGLALRLHFGTLWSGLSHCASVTTRSPRSTFHSSALFTKGHPVSQRQCPVSYTHLRAHETG